MPLFSTILLQHHLDETCAWLRCLSLDASTRAATLLAQQQAAAGTAGRGRLTRQARTPAAERREIWRVLQVGYFCFIMWLLPVLLPVLLRF